ncbi:class I SAM-dependent methyltransferase [Oceanirhabdus seepicola]|uniref:Methyltransferase domain-containing protein n=1 Tax=Oceanirhabdus seepicola TaxID=2828781 RepID=A0A9J6P009_9CLOT|nr:class I SAM-dependent methyltransferase [Oceanirhabdus seepicola]MCM1990127.1 methyltransferase domain-containing protein [Oceanirhabdus seepicola]
MMFYDILSKYYDTIFPFSNVKKEFLMEEFRNGERILDVACGSGTYSLELDEEGKKVTAIDLDEKMVELLRNKKTSSSRVHEMVMDMTKIKELNQEFDGIFCIGNSLVHLPDKKIIGDFINDCYDVLSENGKMIIQVINYDKILKENMSGLPDIVRDEGGLEFIRDYIMKSNGNIEFKGTIKFHSGEKYVNSVELVPIVKDELEECFKRFKNVTFYGGFDKKTWRLETLPTVIVAEK